MKYFLGIDIGTSGTKTVLYDETFKAAASATFEYPLYQPNAGWAEQRAEDWWNAVCDGIKSVAGKADGEILSIGLSGQMHGLVMLDENNAVLRPSIIWCDQRTRKECDLIESTIGRERLIEITANPALTGFTASKIMWVKANEPQIYAKCRHILLPKDYIRFMLTGEFATEVSDASGMQLMNIGKREWSDEILAALQIDESLLGKMYESEEITGYVKADVAEKLGLGGRVAVVGGAGDQAASAIGSGIVCDGLVSDTIGSSGVVFAATDRPLTDKFGRVHTFCHAVKNMWHVMGVTQGAGLSLNWFRNCFFKDNSYIELDAAAEKIAAGSDGLIYLPYIMGERSPVNDSAAKGVFYGITAAHTSAHFVRSVLEGVGLSQADCLKVFEEMGVSVNEIRMCGGGAKSKLWLRIFADCFDKDLVTLENPESGTLGVAILAAVGVGLYKDVPSACAVAVKTSSTVKKSADALLYKEFYTRYKKLYNGVKNMS